MIRAAAVLIGMGAERIAVGVEGGVRTAAGRSRNAEGLEHEQQRRDECGGLPPTVSRMPQGVPSDRRPG